MEIKYCNRCGVELVPNNNWGSYDVRNRKYKCQPCKNSIQNITRNTPEVREKLRKRYPAESRKKLYGLDESAFNAMIAAHNNSCAICGTSFSETKVNVDHDHNTGKIRGLLCMRCNTAIGSLNDDIEILKKAILYLEANIMEVI